MEKLPWWQLSLMVNEASRDDRVEDSLWEEIIATAMELIYDLSLTDAQIDHMAVTGGAAFELADSVSVETDWPYRMQLLGILHDIGKASPDTGHSGIDGMHALETFEFPSWVTGAVGFHSTSLEKAYLMGLTDHLVGVDHDPLTDAILWQSDFTTSPIGKTVTVEKRVSEFTLRHGKYSVPVKAWRLAQPRWALAQSTLSQLG